MFLLISSKTFKLNGIPIFPPRNVNLYLFLNNSKSIFTVVDLPLDPVTPIIGFLVNHDANSISLMIGIFLFFIFFIIFSLFDIPGLLIIKSASKHLFVCFPISENLKPLLDIIFFIPLLLFLSLIKISAPL